MIPGSDRMGAVDRIGCLEVQAGDVWEYHAGGGGLRGEQRTIESMQGNCGTFAGGAGCFDVSWLLERAALVSRIAGSASSAKVPLVDPAVGQRPAGYEPCAMGCGRWIAPESRAFGAMCWTCLGCEPVSPKLRQCKAEHPDWTPPSRPSAPTAPVKHPAGILCVRCLVTSERGDIHLETCTAKDFLPADANLSSEEWTSLVARLAEMNHAARRHDARPFIPSVTDEYLFGRPVR